MAKALAVNLEDKTGASPSALRDYCYDFLELKFRTTTKRCTQFRRNNRLATKILAFSVDSCARICSHIGAHTGALAKSEPLMNAPLAYSIAEACEAARIGRTSIYEAISSCELVARKHGRRTVILADDLRRWLQNLPLAESHPESGMAA